MPPLPTSPVAYQSVLDVQQYLVDMETSESAVQLPVVPESCAFAEYAKVFVLTQHWGGGYFHFLIECLPRITLMLDVLLEHEDIKVKSGGGAFQKRGTCFDIKSVALNKNSQDAS